MTPDDYDMCIHSRIINGNIVPCGHCYECQSIRRSSWTVRNLIEYQHSEKALFVTLTFDDYHLESLHTFDPITGLPYWNKTLYQNFLKKLRKKYTFRYFLVHEYGSQTLRPHYHVILYFQDSNVPTSYDLSYFWTYGSNKVDTLNQARIHYTSKYLQKPFRSKYGSRDYYLYMYQDNRQKLVQELIPLHLFENTGNRMSLKPAIGYQLLNDSQYCKWYRQQCLTKFKYLPYTHLGRDYPMPRYYIDKMFSEEEREIIYLSDEERVDQAVKQQIHLGMTAQDIYNAKMTKDEINKHNLLLNTCFSETL